MTGALVVIDHELDEDAGVYRLTVAERLTLERRDRGGVVLAPETLGTPFTVVFDAATWADVPADERRVRQTARVQAALEASRAAASRQRPRPAPAR